MARQQMESVTRIQQERKNPSPINSPHSNGSNSSSNNNNNGVQLIHTPPLTPIPMSRSDTTNPYPTTFVQADTSTFKQVVQMLTGSTETAKQASKTPQDPPLTPTSSSSTTTTGTRNFTIPPIKTTPKKQQQPSNSFKLYERRNNYHLKNSLMINTLLPSFGNTNNNFSPRNKQQEILSPSLLEFPKLTLSPVTPLNIEDPFNKSPPSLGNSSSEEERAIAEKGFYLHPSPISTPRDSEPQLLPLFPVTSPKVSGS